MFTGNTIKDVSVPSEADFVATLLAKLNDLDTSRIASDDGIVMRKAVLGLLEVVGELERRLVSIADAGSREAWKQQLYQVTSASSPDELRLNHQGYSREPSIEPAND